MIIYVSRIISATSARRVGCGDMVMEMDQSSLEHLSSTFSVSLHAHGDIDCKVSSQVEILYGSLLDQSSLPWLNDWKCNELIITFFLNLHISLSS